MPVRAGLHLRPCIAQLKLLSNRNPLHDIPGDLLLPAVVGRGSARIGVVGQALHVLEGHALFQLVGYGGDAKGMRGQPRGQAGILETPLNHAADVDLVHGVVGGPASLLVGGSEEGSILTSVPQACGIVVRRDHLFQVVPDGDLAALAALLLEVQHPLLAGIIETAAAERSHGAGAGSGRSG
jgi:hypothetical protein